jgi:hypothetical protein
MDHSRSWLQYISELEGGQEGDALWGSELFNGHPRSMLCSIRVNWRSVRFHRLLYLSTHIHWASQVESAIDQGPKLSCPRYMAGLHRSIHCFRIWHAERGLARRAILEIKGEDQNRSPGLIVLCISTS